MRCIDADALRDRLQNLGYDDWNQGATTTWAEAFSECADMVEEMPTIEPRCETCEAFNKTRLLIPQPERTGRWIDSHTTCSECGWQMIDDVIESPNIVAFNFCPNCGAEMREPEDIPMEYFESGGR